MELRRLYPEPGSVDVDELLGAADFAALAPDDRPYVVVNMVASVDGRAAFEGRTAALSSEPDRYVFHALRSVFEAMLVGTGTLRAERYGRFARRPGQAEARVARGLEPEPLGIVLSRSGNLPDDIPLFADPEARLAVYTGDDAASPAAALRRVRAEHGVRTVLCEGGPTLNASLLAHGVLDELFLTVAPVLAATTTPLTILGASSLAEPTRLELVWALEAEGELFLRYRVGRG